MKRGSEMGVPWSSTLWVPAAKTWGKIEVSGNPFSVSREGCCGSGKGRLAGRQGGGKGISAEGLPPGKRRT